MIGNQPDSIDIKEAKIIMWAIALDETVEEERENDLAYSPEVDDVECRVFSFDAIDKQIWRFDTNVPVPNCSNKFKPLLETRNPKPFAHPEDKNPKAFLKIQRKAATRRWRRSGKYNGQHFDQFEVQARSRFSALEDRWYY